MKCRKTRAGAKSLCTATTDFGSPINVIGGQVFRQLSMFDDDVPNAYRQEELSDLSPEMQRLARQSLQELRFA